MEGSGNGTPKDHSRSNSGDRNDDVNDSAYPFSAIRPRQTGNTGNGFGDHCYHRPPINNHFYWVEPQDNGGEDDNNANNSESNGDDSLESSENDYDGLSVGSDYINDLGFDDDSVNVDDNVDDKDDEKDENETDENEVVSEVEDEENNDGEDNNEVQRHPLIRFMGRQNFIIRYLFNFTPPTFRYWK